MRRDDSGINVKTTLCSAAARNLEVIISSQGYGEFLYERGNKGRMMLMYEYKVTLEEAKRKRFNVERDISLEIIVRDFMIKYLNGCEVSRDNSVKIKYHPGATTDNVLDYVRPSGRKKPDMIIIHTGTNDIQSKVNTLQKVRKVITTMKEIDVNNEIQIAFSSVIHHEDQDFEEQIKEINRKLENLCKGKGIKFINNNNNDGSCLNRSKLHLNNSGTALLVKNFSQALKPN